MGELDNVVFDCGTLKINFDKNWNLFFPETNIGVKSIKFDKKYTTVTWNDDTKTRVACSEEDEYSRYEAFCAALAKKIFGTSSQVRKIVETKDEAIELEKKRVEREEKEKADRIKQARKDKLWIKKRAKQIVREKMAKELAK
jgi:hypothetical protein